MKKVLVLSLLSCLLLGSSVLAYNHVFPAPGLSGATGVVRIPSANVIPYKNFNIGLGWGGTVTQNSAIPQQGLVAYNMNLGTFHGVELGIVGGTDQTTSNLREGVFVNMKMSLSQGDDEAYPLKLALGVENLFSYSQTDVYMVATKYLKQGPVLTFGFMADFPNSGFRPLGMAGAEFALGNNLFLLTDLLAGETLFQVNAGARMYLTPLFSITASLLNVLDGTQVKDSRAAYLGFSWANPF